MTSLECAETQEHAPEFALGVLHGSARFDVVAHLERCHACAATVADFAEIVDSLTLVAPEVEPPVGFEDHVLRAMHEHRRPRERRRRVLVGLVVLITVVVAMTIAGVRMIDGLLAPTNPPRVASLRLDGATIGKAVVIDGPHAWVMVSVEGGLADGTYRSALVDLKGENILVGEFDVVGGRGTWVVPEALNTELATEVRVLNAEGKDLARGRLPLA